MRWTTVAITIDSSSMTAMAGSNSDGQQQWHNGQQDGGVLKWAIRGWRHETDAANAEVAQWEFGNF